MEKSLQPKYYAVATEDSAWTEYDVPVVKKGEIVELSYKEAKEARTSGEAMFPYTFNMHYESAPVKCQVIKVVTKLIITPFELLN